MKDREEYISILEQENAELKKQLEELKKPQVFIDTQDIEERYGEELYQDYLKKENEELKNQQQEFIKYLEDEIKRLEKDHIYEPLQRMAIATHKYDLSKYKEIIGGVEDENNSI